MPSDLEWIQMVGQGLLAHLNEYKGPPRYVITMYMERIRAIIDENQDYEEA